MDDELSKSVTEAFIQLHDKGLIYQVCIFIVRAHRSTTVGLFDVHTGRFTL